jgi:hypothetical protein
MDVEPASSAFSRSSLSADDGRWMISPAAIRLMSDSSRRLITAGWTEDDGAEGADITNYRSAVMVVRPGKGRGA